MFKRSMLPRITAAAGAALLAVTLSPPVQAHPTHYGSGKEAGFDRVLEEVSPGGVPMERMSYVRC